MSWSLPHVLLRGPRPLFRPGMTVLEFGIWPGLWSRDLAFLVSLRNPNSPTTSDHAAIHPDALGAPQQSRNPGDERTVGVSVGSSSTLPGLANVSPDLVAEFHRRLGHHPSDSHVRSISSATGAGTADTSEEFTPSDFLEQQSVLVGVDVLDKPPGFPAPPHAAVITADVAALAEDPSPLYRALLGHEFTSPTPCVDLVICDFTGSGRGVSSDVREALRRAALAMSVARPLMTRDAGAVIRVDAPWSDVSPPPKNELFASASFSNKTPVETSDEKKKKKNMTMLNEGHASIEWQQQVRGSSSSKGSLDRIKRQWGDGLSRMDRDAVQRFRQQLADRFSDVSLQPLPIVQPGDIEREESKLIMTQQSQLSQSSHAKAKTAGKQPYTSTSSESSRSSDKNSPSTTGAQADCSSTTGAQQQNRATTPPKRNASPFVSEFVILCQSEAKLSLNGGRREGDWFLRHRQSLEDRRATRSAPTSHPNSRERSAATKKPSSTNIDQRNDHDRKKKRTMERGVKRDYYATANGGGIEASVTSNSSRGSRRGGSSQASSKSSSSSATSPSKASIPFHLRKSGNAPARSFKGSSWQKGVRREALQSGSKADGKGFFRPIRPALFDQPSNDAITRTHTAAAERAQDAKKRREVRSKLDESVSGLMDDE